MAKKKNNNSQQQDVQLPEGMQFRSAPVRLDAQRGVPESLDDETRSVEVVCATEGAVTELDRERWEFVPTILLMSGCQIPENRQVILLDTHMRWDTSTVIGSCRELQVKGSELIGRAHYSEAEEAEGPWIKTKEGHLTDYSVGRRDLEAYYVPDGEKQTIAGREFKGPVKVVTKWVPKEMSVCPIGADEDAKARSATPATPENNNPKKEMDMDQRLRAYLEKRGLSKEATDDEAWRYLETLEVRQEGKESDQETPEQIAQRAMQQEQGRIIEVRSICERAKVPEEKITEYITGGKTVDQVRKFALDYMVEQSQASGGQGHRPPVESGKDERDKFREAAEGALILRAGLPHEESDLAPGAMDLRGFSMIELGREALRMAGQPHGGSPMEMIGRALTSSDFPVLLGNTANLSLMAGWTAAEETWEVWADGSGSVSDFKIHTMARAGETDDLDEIGEDDEYKYGKLSEQSEKYQIATFGKLNKISRQALINDDMDAISGAFFSRGESAARKVGDVAYAVLTANSAMGDGKALFHTDHKNLGTAGVVSETTMAEAVKLLGLQKDIGGKRRLNIPLKYFLGPKTIEGSAEIFFNSNQFTGGAGKESSTRTNPYAGTKYARVYDARLDDDSTTAWYFLGPKGKTVKLFFLNGNRTPYLETRNGWTTDGVEYKTRIDVGAKAVDWRGMGKNAGQ